MLSLSCVNPKMAKAAEQPYSATASVAEGCAVHMTIDKPLGVYTIVFRGDKYPLQSISPNSQISATEVRIAGDVLMLMAEPEANRAKVAIARYENEEQRLFPIEYDDELLSTQLATCLDETENPLLSQPVPGSPFALRPTPKQLRQQAETLNVSLDDFYTCPCGQPFASTEMQSPPWHYNQLLLIRSATQCTLQSDEPNHPELLSAGRLNNVEQMDCRALVGIRTENQLVNHQFKNKPVYSEPKLQACYNIISAKAAQWFKAGGNINIVNDSGNASTKKIVPDGIEELRCSAP